eukprot:TRINITY_DN142_c0_g1_i6.p1 TRINITY_DN142_c0_g1~~TRINITY_DN142_c0_g1_i6.p1  ORF type:complete len:137 (+),score=23.56 TRINITY_DN142_c0_g1_i6:330-740(+)
MKRYVQEIQSDEKENEHAERPDFAFDLYYPVKSPRGVALVIGNGCSGNVLESCRNDALRIEKEFSASGYSVVCLQDKSCDEILGEAKRITALDHSEHDSFIFYFSGHGDSNIIYGTSKKDKLMITDIVEILPVAPG